MKKYFTMNTLYIMAAIIAVSAFLLPRAIDAINLHINGISYIAEQTEEYYKITDPIEGEYTIEIDLNNLESNAGQMLFDDGENKISVLEVLQQEEAGYEVIFRSHGSELADGAALVSGIDHSRAGKGFSHAILAEAYARIDHDEPYQLTPSISSGLSYLDGDRFGFYLSNAAEDDAIAKVTVTNLQLNLWAKMWGPEDF